MATAPATRRVQRGRGHSYVLDGSPADGVTWIKNEGLPSKGLINWAAEQSSNVVLNRWDELLEMTPSERFKTCMGARFDTLKEASAKGTDVHALALRLAAGESVEVPDHLAGYVDAYLQFIEEWRPEELLAETVIVNRRYRYMGTFDLICRLGGDTWLLDWKTGGKGIFSDFAIQLAGYRYAETYLADDGTEKPMPKVDRCGCVWLRADGYDLYELNVGEKTFDLFLYAQQIARFTASPKETWVYEAMRPPLRVVA